MPGKTLLVRLQKWFAIDCFPGLTKNWPKATQLALCLPVSILMPYHYTKLA